MARRNPLPEVERQICQRLRLFRINEAGMTGVEFARRLDIDSNRLSSYEHARVPLRYEFADRVCRAFNICQRWLAEGNEPERYYVSLAPILQHQVAPRAIFSEAYQQILKPLLDEHIKGLRHIWSGELPKDGLTVMQELGQDVIGRVDAVFVLNRASRQMAELIGALPPDLYQSFFSNLVAHNRRFLSKHARRIEVWRKAPKETVIPAWVEMAGKKESKGVLDIRPGMADKGGVKTKIRSLSELVSKLRKFTKVRGQKVAVARACHVTRQAVDQWLRGDAKPSAEATFELLNWVEQQERQQ